MANATIVCSTCGARPYPSDPSIRQTYDLLKANGVWSCERHRPRATKAEKRAASALSPTAALAELDVTIQAEAAIVAEAFAGNPFADPGETLAEARSAFKDFLAELERGLVPLRKALAAKTRADP